MLRSRRYGCHRRHARRLGARDLDQGRARPFELTLKSARPIRADSRGFTRGLRAIADPAREGNRAGIDFLDVLAKRASWMTMSAPDRRCRTAVRGLIRTP